MKKSILGYLNNLIPGLLFTTAGGISSNNVILGIVIYIVAFLSLDLHSYIDKELNYPNNIFSIKH